MTQAPTSAKALQAAIAAATRAIPPTWPLAATVAVNPFLGQAHETLAEAGARLARTTGARATMPRAWYRDQIAAGKISDGDLEAALASAAAGPGPKSLAALKAAARQEAPALRPLPLVADLAAAASGTDWPGFIAERIGAWAGSHFDEGQALWAAPKAKCAYAAWRAAAIHDLTAEIAGLQGFARHVAEAPETAQGLIERAMARLGLEAATAEHYFHHLLMSLGGWSQYARYLLWQAELGGGSDDTLTGLLAIRLLWEEALFLQFEGSIAAPWAAARSAHARPPAVDDDMAIDALLQDAAERAAQRGLAQSLSAAPRQTSAARPALQAAFCIDVRSEVFRRALESLSPDIATIGFAGFFGLPTAHRRFASDSVERRLPVLLNPALHSSCTSPELQADDQSARFKARAKRAWGRFKLAAVSSFAFVEATGPVYAGKLVSDALALKPVKPPADPKPHLAPAPDMEAQVKTAEAVLKAMGLTANFARLVLIAGHGAQVTNNPHASALQCGACGGYSGEVNARLLTSLLNDASVRQGLASKGLVIPADTLFVGGLHDTTADSVTLYVQDLTSASHKADLEQAKAWFASAGQIARTERAQKLPRATTGAAIARRSRDWSETRPEWGLAGAQAFIAAPRTRTMGKNLAGRAFLHDYDWKQDKSFSVLELIMTAPVVVASWISLQYYGSTVAPDVFGGGNKLLHNVCGGIGVLEGNGGVLRAGLPWQSVHDGQRFIHEPLRLSVCIEAPREAMSEILARHEGLRALFDKGWLHLFALDEQGHMAWRYAGGLRWTRMDGASAAGTPYLKQAV